MERKDFFATKSLLLYILLPSFPLGAKDGTQACRTVLGKDSATAPFILLNQ